MTDDFIILRDAELDQVSGGDNPYVPPHHTGHHAPGWYESQLPARSRHFAIWTFTSAANA